MKVCGRYEWPIMVIHDLMTDTSVVRTEITRAEFLTLYIVVGSIDIAQRKRAAELWRLDVDRILQAKQ